jgi:hypothetical protein
MFERLNANNNDAFDVNNILPSTFKIEFLKSFRWKRIENAEKQIYKQTSEDSKYIHPLDPASVRPGLYSPDHIPFCNGMGSISLLSLLSFLLPTYFYPLLFVIPFALLQYHSRHFSSVSTFSLPIYWNALRTPGRSIITKKGDGSQVKESTDSSTTIEDDDVKGRKFPPFLDASFSLFLWLKKSCWICLAVRNY